MADYTKLAAEVRTKFGKGAARKLRAADKIPAVVYGHGTEPKHISLPGHETMLLVRTANAVVDLDIEGAAQLALVKDVQRDPVRQIIEHIDLVVLRRQARVHGFLQVLELEPGVRLPQTVFQWGQQPGLGLVMFVLDLADDLLDDVLDRD